MRGRKLLTDTLVGRLWVHVNRIAVEIGAGMELGDKIYDVYVTITAAGFRSGKF
jgi:hypothetical protein